VPQTWQLPESQPIEPTSRASIWVVFENLNLLEASALMAHLPEHHKTSFYKDALSGLTDVNCRVVNPIDEKMIAVASDSGVIGRIVRAS
jgi:hypothetical protein